MTTILAATGVEGGYGLGHIPTERQAAQRSRRAHEVQMSSTPPTHIHTADGSSEIERRLNDDVASARAQVAKFEAEYEELLADPGVNQEDRDGTRTLLEAARATAAAAERALERFQGGSYGLCEKCGKPIAPERLEAIPDAVTCVSCR